MINDDTDEQKWTTCTGGMFAMEEHIHQLQFTLMPVLQEQNFI